MDRRDFIKLATMLGISPAMASSVSADSISEEKSIQQHLQAMQTYAEMLGGEKVTIGMLVYPGMFLQDLVGPLTVFEALMNRDIHLLWKDLQPVGGDKPESKPLIPVTPTTTFAQCPAMLDVLFVPGGVPGTFNMMEDEQVLGFLAEQGKHARFVTSVCTGSLILGAAGLLDGYKATSHWVTRSALAELGAIPTPGRIVVDRNRITGGGVTAGIDFALQISAMLRSQTYAEAIQLYLEYDPQPPFDAGSPEKAPAEVTQLIEEMFAGSRQTATEVARRAYERLLGNTLAR